MTNIEQPAPRPALTVAITPTETRLVWSAHNALRLALLVPIAAGLTYGMLSTNMFTFLPWYVRIVSLSGWFALLFIALNGMRWLHSPIIPRWPLVIIPTLMLLHQLVIHGILFGALRDFEFRMEFIIFATSILTVIAGSVLWVTPIQLHSLNRMTSLMSYAMGGIGLLQFIISNRIGRVWYALPESLLYRNRDDPLAYESGTGRFGSLIRATGLSIEPSYYGSGMAILFGLSLTCIMLIPQKGLARWSQWGAMLMALVGVIISTSVAAWVLTISALAAWLLAHVQWRGILPAVKSRLSQLQRRAVRRIVLLMVLAGIITMALLVPFLANRLENLQRGADHSANARVLMAVDLLRQPGDTLRESLWGTGLAHESRSRQLFDGYKRYNIYSLRIIQKTPIWNGYAYFAVIMGYSGLLLYIALAATAVFTRNQTGVPLAHLSVLVILYPMAHGVNLYAPWFGFVVLVVVLKSIRYADA